MPSINLGSMYTSGGRTVISGGNSQLDTESLINSLAEARRLPAVKLESTLELNASKIDALGEFRSILESLQTSVNFLRNVPGIANQDQNVFSYSGVKLTSNSAVAASSYATVTAAAGTDTGNFSFTVDQLATRQLQVTNNIALADTGQPAVGAGLAFNAGTLRLGASATEITLEDGDSLATVVAKINAVKTESGVEASLIKVSDGNYQLTFKATQTGTDQNFDFEALNPGMLNVGFYSQTDAVDAMLTIDGVQVTRQSNVVNDLLDGVSINLLQRTPGGTELNLSIEPDVDLAKDAIMNFVDAYNNFRVFLARQTSLDDEGQFAEDAVLATDGALRSMNNALGTDVSTIIPGLSGVVNSLSAIGITLTDYPGDDETPLTRNILTVNEATLDAALASDYDAVRRVFEFDYTADNAEFLVYSHSQNNGVTNVQFNIDKANSIYTATFTLNGNTQTIDLIATDLGTGGGVSLRAADDSALAGLNVIYGLDDAAVVNLSMSQGIADRLYNTITNALGVGGVVTQQVQSIDERNVRIEEDIARIDAQIEQYRESLLQRFSALESAISSVNNILMLLDAQADARSNM